VIKVARELKTQEHATLMFDLIGVVCAPTDDKYLQAVRSMWKEIRDDAVPEFKTERVRYEGSTPVIPWLQASRIMMSQMAVFKRVNGG
jgi:hypothetical protein